VRLVLRITIFEFHYNIDEVTTLDHILAGGFLHKTVEDYINIHEPEEQFDEIEAVEKLANAANAAIDKIADIIRAANEKGVIRLEYDITDLTEG